MCAREGRADLGLAKTGASSPVPGGRVGGVLREEAYALAHPAGHPAPRTLPLLHRAESRTSYTRAWWAARDRIPLATAEAQDVGAVLSTVARGLGMPIMPELSLEGAAGPVAVTDLGPDRPTCSVGYDTTPELGRSLAARALVGELRVSGG